MYSNGFQWARMKKGVHFFSDMPFLAGEVRGHFGHGKSFEQKPKIFEFYLDFQPEPYGR